MTSDPLAQPEPADRSAAWEAARAPYDPAAVVALAGGAWREVRLVAETGSTNADLAALARAGEPGGLVLVAERQTAGRGRLGRAWSAPEGACLTASVLVRPDVPASRLGWLPLVAGLAVAEALAVLGAPKGAGMALKWPNDVLLGDGKAAGLLAERVGDPRGGPAAVVVGFGVNVGLAGGERPVPEATSLRLAGAPAISRTAVLAAVLARLDERVGEWQAAGGDPLASGMRERYVAACATLGRAVRVVLPGGEVLEGRAVDVDRDGRLVVEPASGEVRAVAAGDVVHASHA